MSLSSTGNSIIEYDRTIGLTAMEGRGFSNPVDLAISSGRRIYVLSRTNPTQTEGIRVGICNLESDYFGEFGAYGTGDGQFVWPTALAFDSQDRLYLADEHSSRITIFDTAGGFVGKWGQQGAAEGMLHGPAGLAFDANDNIYVSDHRNNRVQKFTKDGRFLLAWGSAGGGDGELNLPWGLCVASDGDVYVADWRNDRIQRFTADGDFVSTLGEPGGEVGRLNRPASVAVDERGIVYVADWGNHRVVVFGPDGDALRTLRGEATLSPWASDFYRSNPDEKRARDRAELEPAMTAEVESAYEESARVEKYFWGPCSVKLDTDGRLYVTESTRHRVQVYRTRG